MNWVKDNWGTLVSIVLTIVFAIASGTNQLLDMMADYPTAAATWTVSMLCLGSFAALLIVASIFQRKMKAKDAMIAELEERPTPEYVAEFERVRTLEAEREQITRDLSSVHHVGLFFIVKLYFTGFEISEGDMSEAGDSLVVSGIAYTAPCDIDGRRLYKVELVPDKRALYARHEGYFFDEIERMGRGMVEVNRSARKAFIKRGQATD